MSPTQKKPIAITCGDPAGIGPELIQTLVKADPDLVGDCVLIGPAAWLNQLTEMLPVATKVVGPAKEGAKPIMGFRN